ncbi:MAG: AAA family ATPase [Chloroflexota bacterium]|nr:AAA family ATPase [Chloroflexota bacterium]
MGILHIKIDRYRGLEHFEWQPSPGINCLIGPGDVGKSTVLAAISLLLSPRPNPYVSEYDYHKRKVEDGFSITAVLGDLDDAVKDSFKVPLLRGWKDGKLTPLPDEDGADDVLVVQAVGTPDLEVAHHVIGPNEDEAPFPVIVRRKLLLTHIAAEVRAMGELRLGRGTLLERYLGTPDLRAAMSDAVANASEGLELPPAVKERLDELCKLFADADLPAKLHLGLITPQERTLIGLLGLLSGETVNEAIPVAFAGTGTAQLALFELAVSTGGKEPIVVLDEPETGLEPYRQRRLVRDLRTLLGTSGQGFLTTHSPAILEVLKPREVTRVMSGGTTASLSQPGVEKMLVEEPDAFLSRLPVLCEGPTEAGFLSVMLEVEARSVCGSLDTRGIRLVARHGQPSVLDEAKALLDAGITLGLFVDAESKHTGHRDELAEDKRCAFGSWTGVRNIEEAVATWLPVEQFSVLLETAAQVKGSSTDALLQQVGELVGWKGKHTLDEIRTAFSEADFRSALKAAMLATDGKAWFKTLEGGRALGKVLLKLGPPKEIADTVKAFWTEIRRAAEIP